uniref:Cytochrome c oxidase subunit 7A2, mitochondrial n=1 Tax=Moschus moschiferus TaxID=68415 RepID=A0A8C6DIN2_MOSMO
FLSNLYTFHFLFLSYITMHLKDGIADVLLYRATMILTVGGMAYAIYQLVVASFPKKQDWLQFILPAISWFRFIQLSVD